MFGFIGALATSITAAVIVRTVLEDEKLQRSIKNAVSDIFDLSLKIKQQTDNQQQIEENQIVQRKRDNMIWALRQWDLLNQK